MNKINFARVMLGGLVAGLVMNIGEFVVNDLILGAQMKAFFARLNLPDPGGSFIAVAVILTFVMGVVLVWLYAAMRPRLGPGPKTAICAGVIGWLFACVYCGIINGMVLQVPGNMMVIGIVWCFFEYTVATIAGAWLYKEA
ncbi:MAG TPA: hypothetical protein VL866_21270 [Pyrinomonadaceae bacterium]|nr:hypothetical protein [Pyrinomonadaceae bacterium]